MVRQERRADIRKDKTPYKCIACESVWVSQEALDNHMSSSLECAAVYVKKEEAAAAQREKRDEQAANKGRTTMQQGNRYLRISERLTPVRKELKIDMARMLIAQTDIPLEDRVMPRQGRMYVTPGMARYWMKFNGNNVEPSYERVEEYAQEMEAGRWYDSRNPICFRDNGDLCSGQHRLLMHHYTDTGFEYQIELGVTEEEEAVIDIGRKRTIANFLSRGNKIDNHRHVAICATILWSHDEFPIPFNGIRTFRGRPQTVQGVILPYVRKHPEIEEAVSLVHAQYKAAARLLKGIGPAAALYVLMSRSQANHRDRKINEFWGLLSSGQMLQTGDPIYALREQLINGASNPKMKLDTTEVMAKAIKAFNDFVANRRRKTVMWRKDEVFPRVV